MIQEGLYTRRDLSPDLVLFWRLLRDLGEVEVVLRAKTKGYAALGWRPADATKACQAWPKIEGMGILDQHDKKKHHHHHDHADAEGKKYITVGLGNCIVITIIIGCP